MKNPANSNIYEANAWGVLEAFDGYVEGAPEDALLAVAAEAQPNEVRAAVASSAERLGFGGIAWVNLNGGDMPLGAKELMSVVEGLDPLALVALDAPSVALLAEAYRCDVPADACTRVFGRPAAAFADFAKMLGSDDRKQRAWALLKKLGNLA